MTDTAPATLYGIANCDRVRKARRWLASAGVPYAFHDYGRSGIDLPTLQAFCRDFGWQSVLNRRGTTWRRLDDTDKADIDEARAIRLMQLHTSLIRRPVLEYDGRRLLGFDPAHYVALFGH